MHTFVAKSTGGLLAALLENSQGRSRTALKSLLTRGAVRVNGRVETRHDTALAKGDRVTVGRASPPPESPRGLRVVFEDASIVVIDKPAGLLTIATESEKNKTAYRLLNDALASRGERAFIVHRLDRDTSGLLVFAKSEEAKLRLQERWPETEKRYWAIVHGVPAKPSATLIDELTENRAYRVYGGDRTGESKRAVTRYEVKKSSSRAALLDVTIETGRKHQIRVQLAGIGHPVLGDATYGKGGKGRLALHARLLSFFHPETGKRVTFESPLPPDLSRLV
jgi:23S rRNA pseudouridine1911/1915/1917 synthase